MASNPRSDSPEASEVSKMEEISNKNRSQNGKIDFRPARLEDIKHINNLLAPIHFEVGEHIFELYFLNSDHRWVVAVNDHGEIVAFDSSHILPLKNIRFGFLMFVNDAYRNRGIIGKIGSICLPDHPQMGNASPQSMILFPQMEKFDTKLLGYIGQVDPDLLVDFHAIDSQKIDVQGIDSPKIDFQLTDTPKIDSQANNSQAIDSKSISNLGEAPEISALKISAVENDHDIDQVINYDRSRIFLLDRDRFMRAWCAKSKSGEKYAKTLVVRRKNRVVGFGVLRELSDYYSLVPVYADDDTVAKRLLTELFRIFVVDCGREELLYVYFDAKNHLMMEFVHRLKFEQTNCENRHYAKGAAEVKEYCRFDRVYSFTDYWPV